jgi:hypothetical protein
MVGLINADGSPGLLNADGALKRGWGIGIARVQHADRASTRIWPASDPAFRLLARFVWSFRVGFRATFRRRPCSDHPKTPLR